MYIFVFGSNLAGRHGAGGALTALKQWGAIYGRGVGRQGRCYGLPTKGYDLQPLPLDRIQMYVHVFLLYAERYIEDTFLVTRVGCGRAGYTDWLIAPMFSGASSNCEFDPAWSLYGLKTWKVAPNEAAKELSRRAHETAIP